LTRSGQRELAGFWSTRLVTELIKSTLAAGP